MSVQHLTLIHLDHWHWLIQLALANSIKDRALAYFNIKSNNYDGFVTTCFDLICVLVKCGVIYTAIASHVICVCVTSTSFCTKTMPLGST